VFIITSEAKRPLHVKLEQRRSEHPVGCHELFRRGTFMGKQLPPAKVAEQKASNVPLWHKCDEAGPGEDIRCQAKADVRQGRGRASKSHDAMP